VACCDIEHTVVSTMLAGMNENVWRDIASYPMKCDTAGAVIITHSDSSVVSPMGDLTLLLCNSQRLGSLPGLSSFTIPFEL